MRRNILKIMSGISAILPFFVGFLLSLFLPDKIPVHFNLAGKIDRWGKLWEFLFCTITLGSLSLIFYYITNIKKLVNEYPRVMPISVMVMSLTFLIIMLGWFVGISKSTTLVSLSFIEVFKLIFILCNLLIASCGFIFMYINRDRVFGIKVKINEENNEKWFKFNKSISPIIILLPIIFSLLIVVCKSIYSTVSLFVSGQILLLLIMSLAIYISNKRIN